MTTAFATCPLCEATCGLEFTLSNSQVGANSNLLADETLIDPPSGNAVLNGIPVELAAVQGASRSSAQPAPERV
jgi:hypothetical protein